MGPSVMEVSIIDSLMLVVNWSTSGNPVSSWFAMLISDGHCSSASVADTLPVIKDTAQPL